MNEEEKKAIEFINDLITWDVRQDLCPNKEESEKLETILNLIEMLQKENEELKENKTGLEEEIQEQAKNLIRYEEYIRKEYMSRETVKDKIEAYKNIDSIEELYINKRSVGKDIIASWTGRNLDITFANKIKRRPIKIVVENKPPVSE